MKVIKVLLLMIALPWMKMLGCTEMLTTFPFWNSDCIVWASWKNNFSFKNFCKGFPQAILVSKLSLNC